MKEFMAGVLLTVPITALLLLFVLDGRQGVQIRQERIITEHQLSAEEFDSDFASAWGGNQKSESFTGRDQRIAALRARRERFDQDFEKAYKGAQNDAEDLRRAITEGRDHGLLK